jgi:hypothetical protein
MDQPANLDARLNLPEALVRYQIPPQQEAAFNELHHDAVTLDAVVAIAQSHGYVGVRGSGMWHLAGRRSVHDEGRPERTADGSAHRSIGSGVIS